MLPTRRAPTSRLASLVVPSLALLVACTAPGSGPMLEENQQALNAAANLDQCANGPLASPVLCEWQSWINGNLNESKAHYFEGDSVPYRMRFSNLDSGSIHVVVIEWDTSEGEHHALDYLTTWDRTVGGDPCTDVAGCSTLISTSYPIPVDPIVASGADGVAGTDDDIAQIPGAFELFGGTITGVGPYTVAGTYPSTTQTRLAVTFTADVANPVLAWGGHISLRSNWRPELTAATIPGAPFHMRLIDLDGQGGNQDRSLAAAAVYNFPSLTVIKHVVNDDHGTSVAADFQIGVTGPTPSPAAFPGDEAGTIVTLGGEGAYAVAETELPGYVAAYSADCSGTLRYEQVKTCTITNDDADDLCLGVTCDPETACMQAGVCSPTTGQCEYLPKPADTMCRAAAGDCDVAEYCDGATAACPADGFASATVMCREGAGVCDQAEFCTGSAAACPADAFVDASVTCRASGGICDVAELCTGMTAACPGDAFVDASVTCRAAGDVCDVAEACTGASKACPVDGFAATDVTCREADGVCDVAETCTGTTGSCPGDAVAASTVTCREADGVCDVAEECTGASKACPSDAFAATDVTCREADGVCDVAETCTGTTGSCPGDAVAASTVTCREADGICDVAEACDGSAKACPTNLYAGAEVLCREDGGLCDVAEVCDGSGPGCPADVFEPASVTCRESGGICDVAETCTGSAAACPADGFLAASTECRADGGACDVAEFCTGGGALCPDDGFEPASVTCRESGGICDVAETCTGSAAECPADAFVAATETCRESGGICDVAEACTGSAAACPADGFKPETFTCRDSAGICDVAEACTGSLADCPTDALIAAGTECRASGGECDVAELCTGLAIACPDDAKLAAGTLCRSAAGACDLPEACDGATNLCAPNAFVAFGTECRASANACDPAEACTGSLADCPIDDAADCELCGQKYYDANASGVNEGFEEAGIAGWLVELIGPMAAPLHATTIEGGGYEFTNLPAGDYVLCERYPVQANWLQTGPADDCYAVTLPSEVADSCALDFGNLCLGEGGGHTLGYWSNKNGAAALRKLPGAFEVLRGLNLVTATGASFDPADYKAFRPWLLEGTATNMAYMLSVQLAAMELNVMAGYVDEDQLVYVPGLEDGSAVTLPGYLSVYELMTKANLALATERSVFSDSPQRAYLEALKTGLDRANNNRNFVQPGACPATFPTVAMY